MKWGILGLGTIAKEFAQSIPVYACAARNLEKAQAFQKDYAVEKAYGTYDELINDAGVECVYIAVVNSFHVPLIEKCLKAKKCVLCEKALTTNLDSYHYLLQLAEENGVYLAEAMTIYHMPLYQTLQEQINQNSIGKIKFVQAQLGSLKEDSENTHFFKKKLGGGAMADIGTYVLSFVNFFMQGIIIETKALQAPYTNGVDEMWNMALKTDSDELGSAICTYRCKLPKRAIIGGEEGYYVIDDYPRADTCQWIKTGQKPITIQAGETNKALYYEAMDFEKAIREKDETLLYQKKTEKVIELMDKFLKENQYTRY